MSSAVPESYPSRELDIQVNKWTPNCVDIKSTEEFRAVLDQAVSFEGVIPTLSLPKVRNLPRVLDGLRKHQEQIPHPAPLRKLRVWGSG